MSVPVLYETLLQMSGGETVADVKRFLRKNKIPAFRGKAGLPSTTQRALDVALGVAQNDADKEDDELEF